MNHPTTTPGKRTEAENYTLRRARELSRREALPLLDMDKLLSTVPKDWSPKEDDVDEFLASIRLGRCR